MVRRGGGGGEPGQADLVDSDRDLRQAVVLQGLKKARLLNLIILKLLSHLGQQQSRLGVIQSLLLHLLGDMVLKTECY